MYYCKNKILSIQFESTCGLVVVDILFLNFEKIWKSILLVKEREGENGDIYPSVDVRHIQSE